MATIPVAPPSPPTLLVVDDDRETRMLLCELFVQKGICVNLAEDGAAAIQFLEQNDPPSAILLDLVMPGITGTGVLSYLESRPCLKKIPVAIMSGTPYLAPRGYPVFKKPFRFGSLLKFVREACDTDPMTDAA